MTGTFDTKRGFLLIDQASATRAESLITKLRHALGGSELKLPRTQNPLVKIMSQWIYQRQADGNFELDSDCVLTGIGEDAAVIRMSKQDLISDEVIAHLDNKEVTSLGLIWDGKIRFILTDDFSFKRIQFLDVLQEEANEGGEDRDSLYTATQLIATETLGQMIEELIDHLGGFKE